MAVTINQEPKSFTPSDNEIIWTWTSNQTANVNFVFLVKAYVNGIYREEHLIFVQNGNYAKFNARDLASRFTSLPAATTDFERDAGNSCTIYLEIYERYGDPASNQASATTSTITAFKSALKDEDFIAWDHTKYVFGAGCSWMTLFPTGQKYFAGKDENIWIMMMTNNQVGLFMEIELYDEDGGLIFSDSAAVSQNKFTIVNVSQSNIIAQTTITQDQFNSASYYEVWLDPGGTPSKKFRVYIDKTCDLFVTKRIVFNNSLGGIEAFSFTKISTENRNIASKSFEKRFGSWNDSNEFVFDMESGREQDYLITSRGSMILNSDFIPEAVQNWLVEELYHAPFKLMQYDGKSQRIKIISSAYSYKKRVSDMVFNEILEIGLSDNRTSLLI